jgi:hypothetical protein
LIEGDDVCVWELITLKNMSGACSLKSLLLEGFTDRVHNEGLQNGFEDFLITLHSHKMATNLATSVDRSSCKESRKV